MGAKKQTIGYHYLFSLLFGLCRGPINQLYAIRVGDKDVWGGNLCTSDAQYINQPDIFGGEKKEGGIQGPFALYMGGEDQILPGATTAAAGNSVQNAWQAVFGKLIKDRTLPGVKSTIGGLISEFRGVTTLWFDGLVTSMNPYPKAWKFRVRRGNAGWYNDDPWYPERATIFLAGGTVHAMNPAHMIYQACTDPMWGRGLDRSMIDENSFVYAANRLCAEGFGLCMVWYRKEDIDAFIQTILDHIGGVTYTDRETGKIVLRLIRDDYALNDLPLFTPDTGLLNIQEDDSESADTAFTEVIVTGHDPITDQDIQQRSQNIAAWQSQGAIASNDLSYPGLPTLDLCARVAQRDLRVHAAGLKKFELTFDRRAWRIAPGSVIKISDPRRGIGLLVLRVGEIDDGNMVNGQIKMKAVQDVFGLPATAYTKPVESTWENPNQPPEPSLAHRALEASYRDLYLRLDASELAAVTPDDSYLAEVALAPNSVTPEYDLYTKADGEADFAEQGTYGFTASATLDNNITPLQTTFTIGEITNDLPDGTEIIGQAVQIDDEIMRIDDFDLDTRILTVARGTVDTIPHAHLSGARLWFIDDDMGTDGRIYTAGETVKAKVLPRTNYGIYPLEQAIEDSVTMAGRAGRPYPPADVRLYRPHRYWRLYITENQSGTQTSIKTLRFYGPEGELTGTLSADSTAGGYPLSNINDDGTENPWASTATAFPHWVAIDLGSGNQAPVTGMLLGGRGGFYGSQTPRDYVLQWSDDDSEWNDWLAWEDQAHVTPVGFLHDTRGATSIFDPRNGTYAEPVLTWVERNRLTQMDHLIGHTEGSILPEEGTTYRVTVFNGNTQIGLYSGITDLFFHYDNIKQAGDGAYGTVRFKLQAERDGYLSNAYDEEIVVSIVLGYGYGYGLNYGGTD